MSILLYNVVKLEIMCTEYKFCVYSLAKKVSEKFGQFSLIEYTGQGCYF